MTSTSELGNVSRASPRLLALQCTPLYLEVGLMEQLPTALTSMTFVPWLYTFSFTFSRVYNCLSTLWIWLLFKTAANAAPYNDVGWYTNFSLHFKSLEDIIRLMLYCWCSTHFILLYLLIALSISPYCVFIASAYNLVYSGIILLMHARTAIERGSQQRTHVCESVWETR